MRAMSVKCGVMRDVMVPCIMWPIYRNVVWSTWNVALCGT